MNQYSNYILSDMQLCTQLYFCSSGEAMFRWLNTSVHNALHKTGYITLDSHMQPITKLPDKTHVTWMPGTRQSSKYWPYFVQAVAKGKVILAFISFYIGNDRKWIVILRLNKNQKLKYFYNMQDIDCWCIIFPHKCWAKKNYC